MLKLRKEHYKVNLENPIKNEKDDIFGYDYEVKRIKNAIDDGANSIGIISDYGSGKSSLIKLLSRKLCFFKYKIIKVNLWDDKLAIPDDNQISNDEKNNGINKNITPSRDSIIRLHKTFLRQVSSQRKKYNEAYINKRINANYGAAKISFPSYVSLAKWFIIYISILIIILYLVCKFGLNITSFKSISLSDKKQFLSFFISKIPAFLTGFVIFYIVFNREVLFSFWNNSKSREITEEDTVQIYNELFGKRFRWIPRLRKIIIVIEDLDRIDNNKMVEFYLSEFYRLYIEGNEKSKKDVTMIFCLKDSGDDSSESKYIKMFDYISYINKISIDDKGKILELMISNDDLLYDLSFNKQEGKIDISNFLWLVEGESLNIRTIKRRIEHFKSIYLMIRSRGRNSKSDTKELDIDLTTCAFASYLKTEFSRDLDNVLNNYDGDKTNYIDRCVNKKIVGELKDSFEINLDENASEIKIKKLFIAMVKSGHIDSQYKKYFYNFPKGTKIYTTTEKYVYDFIANNQEFGKSHSTTIIKMFNDVDSNFVVETIKNVNSLGKDMPNIALYESQSFLAAKSIDKLKLTNRYKALISFDNNDVDNICNVIDLFTYSNINKNELANFISNIVNDNLNIDGVDENDIYKYRKALANCFGEHIIIFTDLYKKVQLTKSEIEEINNLKVLLSIAKLISHDETIDRMLVSQFNKINADNKNDYLMELIDLFCNYKLIYDVDTRFLSDNDKNKLYLKISEKGISNDEKLELLIYLNYNNSSIADELIDSEKVDEGLLIKYLNKQDVCSEKCKGYINSSLKLFDISDVIFHSLDENSEKYYAYYIYKNHKIESSCDGEMVANIFLKYSEITEYFDNDNTANAIKKYGAYRSFNSYNVTNEKMMILTRTVQTKSIVKSIFRNKGISDDIKCNYFRNIKNLTYDAAKYITTLVSSAIPIAMLKAIRDNRLRIYSSFDRNYKRKIATEINKKIGKLN